MNIYKAPNLIISPKRNWMKKYNIGTNLIQVIKNLYNKATSAILFNSSIGNWFRATVEAVTSFKYLGSVITDEGSKPEILSRIAQATAAFTRLKPVWNDGSIFSQLLDTTDALPCHIHLPVCL